MGGGGGGGGAGCMFWYTQVHYTHTCAFQGGLGACPPGNFGIFGNLWSDAYLECDKYKAKSVQKLIKMTKILGSFMVHRNKSFGNISRIERINNFFVKVQLFIHYCVIVGRK